MFNISQRTKILFIITILVGVIILLAGQCYISRLEIMAQYDTSQKYQHNDKILSFTKLFIAKVIKADGEVSFEDRLALENAVRAIDNKQIFDQWEKFVNAKDGIEAQAEVKNLLSLLVNRISY